MNIELRIEERRIARINKDYKLSDGIRSELEDYNVFIFDKPNNFQEVWYLTDHYFKRKPLNISTADFIKLQEKKERQANRNFDAWLYTQNKKIEHN